MLKDWGQGLVSCIIKDRLVKINTEKTHIKI